MLRDQANEIAEQGFTCLFRQQRVRALRRKIIWRPVWMRILGVKFTDGIEVVRSQAQVAAA
jgi:hypothetical protein